MASDEILTVVRFPVWGGRSGFAIEEFARRHGDFAIAGAAVALELQQPRDHGRRSTKTSISPPQGSPTAQASSSLIP